MAGGVFISQNKVRPGAYLNFKSVPKPTGKVGQRGIVTIPLALGWGEENKIIDLNSSDISNGNLLKKIGYYGHEKDILSIREALKNSYKLLLYRLDNNGQKATTTINNLNVIAKYPGVVGNKVSIIIKELKDKKFQVKTLLNSKVMDTQIVDKREELKDNEWVTFAEGGELTETAGATLSGGNNGTIAAENYSKYLELISRKTFNTMGIYTTDSAIKKNIVTFIKNQRENKGKKVQVVINEFSEANYEGIISVDQGYKTHDEVIDVNSFVAYVAGLTAAANINKSNTYKVIEGAIEIINPKTDEEIKEGILKGKFMLSYRQDESIVVETDINTFTEFAADKTKDFSKNRVIRTLDDINNTIKNTFEKIYLGKVDNNDNGRLSFKSDIISYMNDLNKMGAIEDFKSEDIIINAGSDIDSVVIDVGVKPVDAMEKLYMTVAVG